MYATLARQKAKYAVRSKLGLKNHATASLTTITNIQDRMQPVPRAAGLALLLGAASTAAFTLPQTRRAAPWTRISATNEDWRQACDSDGVVSYYDYGVRLGGADSDAAVAASLEAKLKSFEATPEEERAATLGGMIPGSSGTDAFDISLYLAAIPLFGSLALFLFFPAIAPMLAGSEIPPPSA